MAEPGLIGTCADIVDGGGRGSCAGAASPPGIDAGVDWTYSPSRSRATHSAELSSSSPPSSPASLSVGDSTSSPRVCHKLRSDLSRVFLAFLAWPSARRLLFFLLAEGPIRLLLDAVFWERGAGAPKMPEI